MTSIKLQDGQKQNLRNDEAAEKKENADRGPHPGPPSGWWRMQSWGNRERSLSHVDFPAGHLGVESKQLLERGEASHSAATPSPGDLRLAPTPSAASISPTALGCGVRGARCTGDFQGPRCSGTPRPRASRLASGPHGSRRGPVTRRRRRTPLGSVLDALAGRPGDVSHRGTSVSPPVKQDREVKGAM